MERTYTTLLMVFAFFVIVLMGHLYCTMLILSISALMYKEVISLKRKEEKDKKKRRKKKKKKRRREEEKDVKKRQPKRP